MALAGDLAGGLTLIGAVRDDGLDLRQFQRELVDELRALLMVKNGIEPAEGATQERLQELRSAVKDVPTPQLLTALKAFGEADLKADPNSTLPLDIALAECALGLGERPGSNPIGQSGNRAIGQPGTARTMVTPQRAGVTEPRPTSASGRADDEPHGVPTPEPVRAEPVQAGEPEPRAEAPEPQPVRVASNGPAGTGLVEVRAQMRPVYDRARAAGFQLGALLNSGCDIIEADESAIVIGFRHPIHASKASEKPNLDALAAIVSEVMGRPMSVRCVHNAEVEAWTQREAGSRSSLVRAAQEMGGRILSTEPEDPA
jgi:DNA polymerase-3 subunit gamma/tau